MASGLRTGMEFENEKSIVVVRSVSGLVRRYGQCGSACRFDDGCHYRIEFADMCGHVCIHFLPSRENRDEAAFDAFLCAYLAFACDCQLSVCRIHTVQMKTFVNSDSVVCISN